MDPFAGLLGNGMGAFRGAFTPSSPQAGARKGGRGGGGPHRKSCNCKNSRCLKLYCECFASGRYCEGCNCTNCFNNHENEHTRQSAVEAILERNPNAFRPKIQAAPDEAVMASSTPRGHTLAALDTVGKHSKGCNCKKSACLKKYCECFQAGVFCSDACKCIECKNYDGSEQRAQVIACLNMQPGHEVHSPVHPSPLKRLRTVGAPSGIVGSSYGLGSLGVPASLRPPTASMTGPAPARPMLHQVVGDIVKGSVIEELCRLLFLVADEEAERQVSNATATNNQTDAPAAAVAAQQTSLQEAQERVVLAEFIDMFRKMTDTANKKAAQQQQTAAAAVAAAAAAVAAASGNQSGPLSAFGSGGVPPNVMAAAAAAAAAVINRPINPQGQGTARPQQTHTTTGSATAPTPTQSATNMHAPSGPAPVDSSNPGLVAQSATPQPQLQLPLHNLDTMFQPPNAGNGGGAFNGGMLNANGAGGHQNLQDLGGNGAGGQGGLGLDMDGQQPGWAALAALRQQLNASTAQQGGMAGLAAWLAAAQNGSSGADGNRLGLGAGGLGGLGLASLPGQGALDDNSMSGMGNLSSWAGGLQGMPLLNSLPPPQ